MKKSILSVFMITMFLLLSCDFDAIGELIDKASAKLSDRDKNIKSLKYGQEDQEGHQDGGEENLKELRNNIKNFAEEAKVVAKIVNKDLFGSVDPINEGSVNQDLYPYQRPIQIKEEDLVPNTKYEKEAEEGIDKVRIALGNDEFAKLIEDARKLKSEYEQLESSFYNTLLHLQNKRESYSTREDKTNRQQLIQLQNQLNDERSHIDALRMQVDNGLSNLGSAKGLFESAQRILKEAITERLRNKHRGYWVRARDNNLLAKKARSEVDSALSQLESSAISIGEAMARKKDIKKLIEYTKSILDNLER